MRQAVLTPSAAVNKLAVATAVEAVDAGADIVDLGAESTRPNATPISSEQEQARLLPVLEELLRERPHALVSVDTYHGSTARAAARAGAEIINDVSGLTWDPSMATAVAQSGCGLVLMHARGRSGEWQTQPGLDGDAVVPVVFAGLCEQLVQAEAAGIRTERIVADPGFGFGKRGAENFALLARLGRLRELGRPLLVGLSRKGFLGEAVEPLQRKNVDLGRGSADRHGGSQRYGDPGWSARAARARSAGRTGSCGNRRRGVERCSELREGDERKGALCAPSCHVRSVRSSSLLFPWRGRAPRCA